MYITFTDGRTGKEYRLEGKWENGDEIKVEFVNSYNEKCIYTIKVSRKERLLMN